MKKIIVAIGTQNPAKITAIKSGFHLIWPEQSFAFTSIDVNSKVSSQPMSDLESIQGARNRANQALESLSADYGVGIEGGLQQIEEMWFDSGWCVIVNKNGEEGISASAKVPAPKSIMKHVHEGKELGTAIDIVFNRVNSKQAEGHFGLMTNKVVTRTDGYTHAVCLALSRFLHPELFS